MNTDNLYLWLPGEGDTGCVAVLSSERERDAENPSSPAERLESILEGLGSAEAWAKSHAEIFADAPESIEKLRYIPLGENAVFTRGAGAIVWDEPWEDVPVLECTGKPFESGAVQVLTAAEVNAILRVDMDEDAKDWPSVTSGGLDGAKMCMHVYPDGAGSIECGIEFSASSPDNPDVWLYSSYVPMDDIRTALAPVLQSMKEAEDEHPKP